MVSHPLLHQRVSSVKSTAIKSAGAQEWIGAGVPVSGCGCVQWDAVFARRQLFCVYAIGFFFFFFYLFRGEKGKVKPNA